MFRVSNSLFFSFFFCFFVSFLSLPLLFFFFPLSPSKRLLPNEWFISILQPVAESTRFSFGSNDPLSSHHHSARQTRFHAGYAVDLVVARIVFTRGRDQTDLPKTSCCPVIRSFGINVFLSPSPCLLPLFFLSLSNLDLFQVLLLLRGRETFRFIVDSNVGG